MKTVIYLSIHKSEVPELRRNFTIAQRVTLGQFPDDPPPPGPESMRLRVVMFDGAIESQVHEKNILDEMQWVSLPPSMGRIFHGFEVYGHVVVALALQRAAALTSESKVHKFSTADDIVAYDLDGPDASGQAVPNPELDRLEVALSSMASRERALVVEKRMAYLDEFGAGLDLGQTIEMGRLRKEIHDLDLSDESLAKLVSPTAIGETARLAREVKRWRDAASAAAVGVDSDPPGLVH